MLCILDVRIGVFTWMCTPDVWHKYGFLRISLLETDIMVHIDVNCFDWLWNL